MQVILQADVKGLGKKGDVVRVADGYARNYLFPRGLAVTVTEGRLREKASIERTKAEKEARELEEARRLAERLQNLTLRITVKVGEQGRLFGSVTAKDVAEALKAEHGIDVDRRKIALEEPLRHLGSYETTVHLHPTVHARLRIEVVGA